MIEYKKFQPTAFDRAGLGCSDRQDWLVPEIGVNRDSEVRARANWKAFNEAMDKVDPEGNDHEIHRFGHWGNGWFEIVLVRPGTGCALEAERITDALTNYPIVCENTLSDMEAEEIAEVWRVSSIKERLEYINEGNARNYGNGDEYNSSIFAARRDEVPGGNVWDYLRERYC